VMNLAGACLLFNVYSSVVLSMTWKVSVVVVVVVYFICITFLYLVAL